MFPRQTAPPPVYPTWLVSWKKLSGKNEPAFKEIDRALSTGGPENPLSEKALAQFAQRLLEKQDAGFMAADELADTLCQKLGGRLGPEKMLNVLARFTNRFTRFTAKDQAVVALKT